MEKLYRIALSMVPGVGNIGAKRILSRAGSAEAVFRMNRESLMKIPGVGTLLADRILDKSVIGKAEKELDYIRRNNITCLFLQDSGFPERLGHCPDAPLVIYARGRLDFDDRKMLSVVGTRRPTPHGLEICRRLIRELGERHTNLVIVSGLAYGIDYCAHETALEGGLATVAVLGHGLRHMYPALHRRMARKIESCGMLLTDFPSWEKPEKNNFIKRNRIIAGLSEATVVVESGARGGALITADLANSYYREVFAFPGRTTDPAAAGCNALIKTHRAALIESHRDLEYQLGWEPSGEVETARGKSLPGELSPEEQRVLKVLESEGDCSADLISYNAQLPVGRVSAILLGLELSGLVLSMPGNCYRMIR